MLRKDNSQRITLPANRGFVNDLTISTESHIQVCLILQAYMKFKSNTYRCLVITKGQVKDKGHLRITEISTNKWCDASLKDHNTVNRLRQQVKNGMETIEQTLGKHNALMYQHGLLLRLT